MPAELNPNREPPDYLSEAAKAFYCETVSDIEEDGYSLALLAEAARIFDELIRVRRILEDQGQFFNDRFGKPRAHPALKVQADLRNQFNVAFRSLGLHKPPPSEQKKFPWG